MLYAEKCSKTFRFAFLQFSISNKFKQIKLSRAGSDIHLHDCWSCSPYAGLEGKPYGICLRLSLRNSSGVSFLGGGGGSGPEGGPGRTGRLKEAELTLMGPALMGPALPGPLLIGLPPTGPALSGYPEALEIELVVLTLGKPGRAEDGVRLPIIPLWDGERPCCDSCGSLNAASPVLAMGISPEVGV